MKCGLPSDGRSSIHGHAIVAEMQIIWTAGKPAAGSSDDVVGNRTGPDVAGMVDDGYLGVLYWN